MNPSLRILGHGIDLVQISRIRAMLDEHGDRFAEKCFTLREREYCLSRAESGPHFAARFAAKEAVLKALGTGWTRGISWTDIEVLRDNDGVPGVALSGRAHEVAAERGITGWRLSLSHTADQAMASAIATGS